MPALSNHTHCQVAHKSRHTDQNLSKSIGCPNARRDCEDKARAHNNVYNS